MTEVASKDEFGRQAMVNVFRNPRLSVRLSPEDWGDAGSAGLQLKTRTQIDQRFGVFCGATNDGRLMVLRFLPPFYQPDKIEVYATEQEMKERWMLD